MKIAIVFGNNFINKFQSKIIAILTIFSFTIIQAQQNEITITGFILDAVNGMLLDSVKVQSRGITTFSDSKGVFSIKVPVSANDFYALDFSKNNFYDLRVKPLLDELKNVQVKMKSPYPLRNIYHLFTDPNVPERGPNEAPTTPKCADSETVPDLIGGQLNRHNFIYIGENHRRICVVIDGKLAWHYDTENTWEDDEVWVLSNGNVLHAHMTYIEEITPQKEVVWRYDNPKGTEIHTCQPIGVDKVLFLQNEENVAVVKLYNKVTKIFEIDKPLKELDGGPHGQGRRLRLSSRGTYVATSLVGSTFYEYDKDFNLIYRLKVPSMWGGVPLKNGNFLYQDANTLTATEINRSGDIVWEVSIADIQDQLVELAPQLGRVTSTQNCERLSNGNTVIFTRFCDSNIPQAIEVTPGKKVVWILQDWKHLGDSVSAQFLDEPGYPEIPKETNH